jgi:hypothetical protein
VRCNLQDEQQIFLSGYHFVVHLSIYDLISLTSVANDISSRQLALLHLEQS